MNLRSFRSLNTHFITFLSGTQRAIDPPLGGRGSRPHLALIDMINVSFQQSHCFLTLIMVTVRAADFPPAPDSGGVLVLLLPPPHRDHLLQHLEALLEPVPCHGAGRLQVPLADPAQLSEAQMGLQGGEVERPG